jgi:hypothetical protein
VSNYKPRAKTNHESTPKARIHKTVVSRQNEQESCQHSALSDQQRAVAGVMECWNNVLLPPKTAANHESTKIGKHEKGQGGLNKPSPFVFSSPAKLTAGKLRVFVITLASWFSNLAAPKPHI